MKNQGFKFEYLQIWVSSILSIFKFEYLQFWVSSPWRNSQGLLIFSDLTITLRHNTIGGTPLDERSARRRDLYLTNHNTQYRETSMPRTGFQPTIPGSKRPQTHALDRHWDWHISHISYITISLWIFLHVSVCNGPCTNHHNSN
jgi:hypothetical protein